MNTDEKICKISLLFDIARKDIADGMKGSDAIDILEGAVKDVVEQ